MSSADSTFVGLILCDVSVERNGRFDSDEDEERLLCLEERETRRSGTVSLPRETRRAASPREGDFRC